MSLRTELSDLCDRLRELRASWRELELTATEDRPPAKDLAVADRVAETAVTGLSTVDNVLAVLAARQDPGALYQASVLLQALRHRYDDELRSHHGVADLLRGVRGHGDQWRAWAAGVCAGVDRCVGPFRAVEQALLRCWREVAELAGPTGISPPARGAEIDSRMTWSHVDTRDELTGGVQ